MSQADSVSLDLLFRTARTHSAWQDKPVAVSLLREIYDLCKWGPTSANTSPMRIMFIQSKEAKERLKPCLAPGNVEKTMQASVTALIGYDMEFYTHLPALFPQTNAMAWFTGNDALIGATAFRNGSLQGAYFMLAARALGLDCGPMSGFNTAKADAEFFQGTAVKSNFLCNLGYGDTGKLHPRNPRLSFAETCKVV